MKTFATLVLLVSTVAFAFNLPDKIGEWKAEGKTNQYPDMDLYDYIDGDADIYFEYGFKNCYVRSYKKGDNSIEIKVYDQANKLNSFALFRGTAVTEKIQLLEQQEYTFDFRMFNFYKGQFFFEIVDRSDKDIEEKHMISLCKDLSKLVKGDEYFPIEFKKFPIDNRIKYSEKFFLKSFLSRSFFKEVFSVEYQIKDKVYKVFLTKKDIDNTQALLIEKMKDNFSSSILGDFLYGVKGEDGDVRKHLMTKMEKLLSVN